MRILMDVPVNSANSADLHLQLVDDGKANLHFLLKLGTEAGHQIDAATADTVLEMSKTIGQLGLGARKAPPAKP